MNPELDQLTGRFSPSRGKVGLLLCRTISNRDRMVARCKDAAGDDRGFVIALDDEDLTSLVTEFASTRSLGLLRRRFEILIT